MHIPDHRVCTNVVDSRSIEALWMLPLEFAEAAWAWNAGLWQWWCEQLFADPRRYRRHGCLAQLQIPEPISGRFEQDLFA